MIGIALLVDAAVYALLALLVLRYGKRWLPEPWNQPAILIPLIVGMGLMLSLAMLPRWIIMQ